MPSWSFLLLHVIFLHLRIVDSTSSFVNNAQTTRSRRLAKWAYAGTAQPETPEGYALYWDSLLTTEYREQASELRERRSSWSRQRLESSGVSMFDATAEPETELYGEKIVRITKDGAERLQEKYSNGDVLLLTATWNDRFLPRECSVCDVGNDWITCSVGPTWPPGLWEERRRPGSYSVRLDRAVPQKSLLAQRAALQLLRKGEAGEAAAILSDTFNRGEKAKESTSGLPSRFKDGVFIEGAVLDNVEEAIQKAIDGAKSATKRFVPNKSQEKAIASALSKKISLIRGPPGTGKTRVAALLVTAALHMRDSDATAPRILAVAHSNGACDQLLETLISFGIPAIRAGRPATVGEKSRARTVTAMTETHPEVLSLRARARDPSLPAHVRSNAVAEAKRVAEAVRRTISETAPVVVASCIGASQLTQHGISVSFPLVILDEAAQTTEPALVCALAAAKAEQVVLVGDTKQLPPTVKSSSSELRHTLGRSPMARLLENGGLEQVTLSVQYRMPPAICNISATYFYDGLVSTPENYEPKPPPLGFPWPKRELPLAFVNLGEDLEVSHDSGGKSNPQEADTIVRIVLNILATKDVVGEDIAIISPYSRQADLIRGELLGRNIKGIKVGTVDAFQGNERDLVIISGTRSNLYSEVGFLKDPRRLCVAITRAKLAMIVVGSGTTLRASRHWRHLLDCLPLCSTDQLGMDTENCTAGKESDETLSLFDDINDPLADLLY